MGIGASYVIKFVLFAKGAEKMNRKWLLGAFCACALFSVSCGDGDGYSNGDYCKSSALPHNGTDCDGTVLVRCVNDRIETSDCGQLGCEVKSSGAAACKMPDASACGSVTERGLCRNDQLLVCVNNRLQTTNCPRGTVCGEKGDGTFACVDTLTPCGDITPAGKCEDSKTVVYCENGILKRETCEVGCIEPEEGYFQCLVPCSKSLAALGEVGRCFEDKTGFEVCDSQYGALSQNCSRDTVCGENDKGVMACMSSSSEPKPDPKPDQPSTECGSITDRGVCDGNQLKYCDNGKIIMESCSDGCVKVHVNTPDELAQCKMPCGDVTEKGKCLDERTVHRCDKDYGLIAETCNEGLACQAASGEPAMCKEVASLPVQPKDPEQSM